MYATCCHFPAPWGFDCYSLSIPIPPRPRPPPPTPPGPTPTRTPGGLPPLPCTGSPLPNLEKLHCLAGLDVHVPRALSLRPPPSTTRQAGVNNVGSHRPDPTRLPPRHRPTPARHVVRRRRRRHASRGRMPRRIGARTMRPRRGPEFGACSTARDCCVSTPKPPPPPGLPTLADSLALARRSTPPMALWADDIRVQRLPRSFSSLPTTSTTSTDPIPTAPPTLRRTTP
jgi:hypothetical protein